MGSLMESPSVLFPSYLCFNCGVQVASACKNELKSSEVEIFRCVRELLYF